MGGNEELSLSCSLADEQVCMEALDMCLQAYGENSVLSSRLFLNIGIFHEDNRQYRTACEWFMRWHKCSEEVEIVTVQMPIYNYDSRRKLRRLTLVSATT